MKNKKTIFIIVVIILIVLGIVFLLIRTRNKTIFTQIKIEQPTIKSSIETTVNIESALDRNKIQIPSSLPTYIFDSSPISVNIATTLAKKLGFINDVTMLKDSHN